MRHHITLHIFLLFRSNPHIITVYLHLPVSSHSYHLLFLLFPSPWYNRIGWLGVKHQLTYLPTFSIFLSHNITLLLFFYCCLISSSCYIMLHHFLPLLRPFFPSHHVTLFPTSSSSSLPITLRSFQPLPRPFFPSHHVMLFLTSSSSSLPITSRYALSNLFLV